MSQASRPAPCPQADSDATGAAAGEGLIAAADYIVTFVSIIFGLAPTDLAVGLHRLPRARHAGGRGACPGPGCVRRTGPGAGPIAAVREPPYA